MKCEWCNGKGEIINDALRYTSCPACHGTGEIKQTNFDFMRSCTMEEMVDTLAKFKCGGYAIWPSMEEIKQDVRDWLQEEHDG